jgi:hypothetical protein
MGSKLHKKIYSFNGGALLEQRQTYILFKTIKALILRLFLISAYILLLPLYSYSEDPPGSSTDPLANTKLPFTSFNLNSRIEYEFECDYRGYMCSETRTDLFNIGRGDPSYNFPYFYSTDVSYAMYWNTIFSEWVRMTNCNINGSSYELLYTDSYLVQGLNVGSVTNAAADCIFQYNQKGLDEQNNKAMAYELSYKIAYGDMYQLWAYCVKRVIDQCSYLCLDRDGDGYYGSVNCLQGDDCNDNDPTINPSASEVCGDKQDNNCDGKIDEGCCPFTN